MLSNLFEDNGRLIAGCSLPKGNLTQGLSEKNTLISEISYLRDVSFRVQWLGRDVKWRWVVVPFISMTYKSTLVYQSSIVHEILTEFYLLMLIGMWR